jgi:hypothetical protein
MEVIDLWQWSDHGLAIFFSVKQRLGIIDARAWYRAVARWLRKADLWDFSQYLSIVTYDSIPFILCM